MLNILHSLLTFFPSTEARNEAELYGPFVELSNTALQCLKLLEIEGMRKTIRDISFQRNDPKFLKQFHNGMKSTRKPDLIILQPTKKDPKNLHWGDILSVIEFKRPTSKPMKPPPRKYSSGEYQPPRKQFLVNNCVSELQGVAFVGQAKPLIGQ